MKIKIVQIFRRKRRKRLNRKVARKLGQHKRAATGRYK